MFVKVSKSVIFLVKSSGRLLPIDIWRLFTGHAESAFFVTLQGPKFTAPLKVPEDLDVLQEEDTNSRLQYVFDAITLTRQKLEGKVPLLGFTGAPVRPNRARLITVKLKEIVSYTHRELTCTSSCFY